jgi:hypothetical protein
MKAHKFPVKKKYGTRRHSPKRPKNKTTAKISSKNNVSFTLVHVGP